MRLVFNPTDKPLSTYCTSAGGLKETDITLLREQFGKNTLSIATPNFFTLYREQLLRPLSMFQFFTSALWMMDEYWQYTMFSLFNIFLFESTTVWQRLKTLKTLSGMSTKPYDVFVYRNRRWESVSTLDILPGDIISIKREHRAKPVAKRDDTDNKDAAPPPPTPPPTAASDVVPCDCVLLRGSAVVNEATLTGESVPQMKDAATHKAESVDRPFEMHGQDRVHVLFSGACVVRMRVPSGGRGLRGRGLGQGAWQRDCCEMDTAQWSLLAHLLLTSDGAYHPWRFNRGHFRHLIVR